MGLTLLLMRHGEAEVCTSITEDHSRALTTQGWMQVKKIADSLKIEHLRPDTIVCSSAVRTSQTANIIAKELGIPESEIVQKDTLYNTSPQVLLNTLFSLQDSIKVVLLINHNPTIPQLAGYLCGENMGHVFPASCIQITFDADRWSEVTGDSGTLIEMYHA